MNMPNPNPPEDMSLEGDELPQSKDYVGIPRKFQGNDLWPLSIATDLMFIQVRTPGQDTLAYEGLAFVFIHLKRGGTFKQDRQVVAPLCWDIDKFRAAVLDWSEEVGVTPADRLDAVRIYKQSMEEAYKSEVEPVATGGTAQKKTGAQPPIQPASSSTSSAKKRARPKTS